MIFENGTARIGQRATSRGWHSEDWAGCGVWEARPDSKVSLCLGIQKKPETTIERPLRGISEI